MPFCEVENMSDCLVSPLLDICWYHIFSEPLHPESRGSIFMGRGLNPRGTYRGERWVAKTFPLGSLSCSLVDVSLVNTFDHSFCFYSKLLCVRSYKNVQDCRNCVDQEMKSLISFIAKLL
ncbi:unnamed protein product [Ilex paraguariensis]|uniref:Uncharacterized protein n=1 Tax=Ilex paraguariensis TaxID=185542 RepID=A0ABC8S446_9AQUA